MAVLASARSGALALSLAICAAATVALSAPSEDRGDTWARHFLREQLDLRNGELARLDRGDVVVRMVEDPGFREIAVLAAVALPAPPPDWASGYALLGRLRSASPDLLSMGLLGTPPSLEQLEGIAVDSRILAPLQKCRQERCIVNASKQEIDRYRQEIDWQSTDPAPSAGHVFRSVLHDRMTDYQLRGDSALPALANRAWTLTTAEVPLLLLDRRPSLAQLAPRLDTHFRACARGELECPDDVFYWCREKMWRREVVGLYHATFDDQRSPAGRRRVAAEKLVYANHYLLGALTITGLLEDASGTYLFFLNRSETDNRGPFNFIERALAGRLIKRRLERQVEALRNAFTPPRPQAARSGAP